MVLRQLKIEADRPELVSGFKIHVVKVAMGTSNGSLAAMTRKLLRTPEREVAGRGESENVPGRVAGSLSGVLKQRVIVAGQYGSVDQ